MFQIFGRARIQRWTGKRVVSKRAWALGIGHAGVLQGLENTLWAECRWGIPLLSMMGDGPAQSEGGEGNERL